MRIVGYSTDLGPNGIQKEAVGLWRNWGKPKPSAPAAPTAPAGSSATPAEGTATMAQDPYAQYAQQYGANFMEVLQSIPEWTTETAQMVNQLKEKMSQGLNIQFPPGNPLVNPQGLAYLDEVLEDMQTWNQFAQKEMARLEQMKSAGPQFQWSDESEKMLLHLKDVGKRSWEDIAGRLSVLNRVFVSPEQAQQKYEELKAAAGTAETGGVAEPPATSGTAGAAAAGMSDLGPAVKTSANPQSIRLGSGWFAKAPTTHEAPQRRISVTGEAQEEMPDPEDTDEQVAAGEKIEKEHGSTLKKLRDSVKDGKLTISLEEAYKLIALDHLEEIPDYYTRLIEMEEKAKKK